MVVSGSAMDIEKWHEGTFWNYGNVCILIKDWVTKVRFSDCTIKICAFHFVYILIKRKTCRQKNKMSELLIPSTLKKFF